jgi:DNA-binding CsgD family transcriptional regulator/tetratricopeptide (TPR) repeat protein
MHPRTASKGSSLPIVGRDAELGVLVRLLAEVRAGLGRQVVVEGEPGIGKTRLTQELGARAHTAGFTVFHGLGEELQRDRPFRVVVDALEVDSSSSDPDRLRIAELLEEAPDPTAVSGADHRYRIVEAIEDAIERVAMRGPVLFLVEDAHWADASSIFALHVLSRRDDLPVYIVLTCRPVPRSEELDRLLDGIIDSGGPHLRLAPLDDEAVARLAESRLGADPGPVLRSQLARTAGNPLFVLELLDGLAEENMIETRDGAAETSKSVEPPPSLRTVIIRRLGFLSRASLELLRTASVLGESFSSADLAVVTGTPLVDVLATLEEPIAAGFVSAEGEAFAFRHDVVREALYGDVAPAVRKGLHLHIGRSLAAAGSPPIRVAPHIALGADMGDREAVGSLRDAALDIVSRAPGIAADLLRSAAELLPAGDAERILLSLLELRQLSIAGRLDDAQELADEVTPVVAGTLFQQYLDLELFNLLVLQFRLEAGGELADRFLQRPGLPEATRILYLALAASVRFGLGDVAGAEMQLDGVRPFADTYPASMVATLSSLLEGALSWMRGDFAKGVAPMARAVPGTESFTGGRGQGGLLLATALSLADRFDESLETLETARVELERRGMLPYLVEHHWFLAHVLFVGGRWDDALSEMAAARQLTAQTGAVGVGVMLPDPTPFIQLLRGDTDAAQEAFSAFEHDPSTFLAAFRHWREPIRAVLLDGFGKHDAAVKALESWHRAAGEMGFLPDFRTIGRMIVRICRAARDETLLQELFASAIEVHGRAGGVKSVEGGALLVQGAITDDSEKLLDAVDACRAGGRPFDIAEACAEAGMSMLRAGDLDTGRALVMEAFEAYEKLGARRSEDGLAQDVREFGIRRGSRRRRTSAAHGWDALTESERRVVALVAEGLTNGEIARRLYISKGTVATHLRSVFRKVGVSSRTELAAEATRRSG